MYELRLYFFLHGIYGMYLLISMVYAHEFTSLFETYITLEVIYTSRLGKTCIACCIDQGVDIDI